MKSKTNFWLTAATVIVVLLGVLGYVPIRGRYSTQELSQAEVRITPEAIGGDSCPAVTIIVW